MKKRLLLLVVLLTSLVTATWAQEDALTRIPVFTMGESNSQYYRIPALVKAADGSLVCIADKRGSQLGDLPNIISIVSKRSTDGGKTWGDAVPVATADATKGTTYGDAAVVLDTKTNNLVAIFAGNNGLWQSYASSLIRIYTCKSSDNGQSWGEVVDITDQVYGAVYGTNTWHGLFTGSGNGCQLQVGENAGRIMFVVAARNDATWGGTMSNYAIYSDDGGSTWKASTNAAYSNGDESKVVELKDGTVLMSIRNRNKGNRLFAKSTDGGATWTTATLNTNLMDPACNGDIIKYEHDGKYYLLHSLPASSSTRENVTVYLSSDNGETWDIKRQIFSGYSAYSSLAVLNDGTIGIVVEEGKWDSGLPGTDGFNLAYYNFTLDWLLDGQEPVIPVQEGVLDLNGSRYMSIKNNEAFSIPAGGEAGYTITLKVKIPEYKSGQNMRFVNNRAYEGTANSGTTGFDLYGCNSSTQAYSVNLSYDGKPWGNSFNWQSGINEDTWTHITWVLDGTSSYIYADGVLKESKTGMSTLGIPSKADILVGAGYTNTDGQAVEPTYFATGYIDDVRFYNKALSQDEIVADMTATVSEETEGLVAAYDFANIVGYTVPDISGNGHDGTLIGFPEEVQYTVSVKANEGGSATVEGGTDPVQIWDGETAKLEATANEGYIFTGWLVDTKVVSTQNPYIATITEETEFIATFEEEGAFDYCKMDGNSNSGHRRFDSFSFSDGVKTVEVAEIQMTTTDLMYHDRTATAILETSAGATITFPKFDWRGEWMHAFAFVDYEHDGWNQDINADGTTNGNVVSYNYYNGKNSHGEAGSEQYANSYGLPSFVLPKELSEGDYRMRVKIDWNSLDPCGASDIKTNGGCFVDVIIRITPKVKERTITVEIEPAEGGTVTGAGTSSGNITLVATPNPGYLFVDWKLDGEVISSEPMLVDATEGDKTYTATFIASYPIMSYIYTNNETQTNRYLKEVTATAGNNVTTVFSATSEEELPITEPTAYNDRLIDGALIDKSENPIIVEQGTGEMSLNFIAWTDMIAVGTSSAGSQLHWTQQAIYIDWNNNYYFLDENESYGKSGDNMPNYSFIDDEEGYTRTLAIPADIAEGTYKMRVCYFEPLNATDAWHETLFTTEECVLRNGKAYDLAIKVVAKSETGIENTDAKVANVNARNSAISVSGFNGKVQIFNAVGQLINEAVVNNSALIDVAKGVYLVVTDSQVSKVVVK